MSSVDPGHRLAAAALEANAKFRALFDQATHFAGIMTVDGTLIDANKSSVEVCGYARDQVLGRPFWQTPWWRHDKSVQDKLLAATERAAQGTSYREELSYVWADDSLHTVDFRLHPIRDDAGKVIYLHPTGTDITEQKIANQKIQTLTENLEAQVSVRTSEIQDRNADMLRQSALLGVLSRRLMEVQDSERRRISRELHDSAGQLLSVLSVNLAAITRQTKAVAPHISDLADESHKLARQIMQEIRTMSYLLHPPLLEEAGLVTALEVYVAGLNDRGSLAIKLVTPEKFPRLSSELELAAFRVVQECLTNVHRHSGSRTATVELSADETTLTLEVCDQGKGISAAKLEEIQSHGSGVGIQGIRERLRPFNGDMRIHSTSSGTAVVVTFRIPQLQIAQA
jgi:PAS domain S-box-containing protein